VLKGNIHRQVHQCRVTISMGQPQFRCYFTATDKKCHRNGTDTETDTKQTQARAPMLSNTHSITEALTHRTTESHEHIIMREIDTGRALTLGMMCTVQYSQDCQ
jgi:hypothetical protein